MAFLRLQQLSLGLEILPQISSSAWTSSAKKSSPPFIVSREQDVSLGHRTNHVPRPREPVLRNKKMSDIRYQNIAEILRFYGADSRASVEEDKLASTT